MSGGPPAPDFGEVRRPGLVSRWLRRPPRVVREANFAAALAALPAGAVVERTDPRGNWITFRKGDGKPMVRFRASEAWLEGEPTVVANDSDDTAAAVQADGTVVIYEGLHRTRAAARHRVLVREDKGGAPSAPGWLDFDRVDERPPATSSTRALMELMGGDPDAPPVPAR